MTGQLSYRVYPNHSQAVYSGPEQRRKARRVQTDRRGTIRWEPKKHDRREGSGRRTDDLTWDAIRSLF